MNPIVLEEDCTPPTWRFSFSWDPCLLFKVEDVKRRTKGLALWIVPAESV